VLGLAYKFWLFITVLLVFGFVWVDIVFYSDVFSFLFYLLSTYEGYVVFYFISLIYIF